MNEFETWWIKTCCPAMSDLRVGRAPTFKDVAQMAWEDSNKDGYSKGYKDGYEVGTEDGYSEGIKEGIARESGQSYFR
jgi:hypothetical protein